MDENARDQFVTLVDDDVTINWNMKSEPAEAIYHRNVKYDSFITHRDPNSAFIIFLEDQECTCPFAHVD